MRLALGQKPPEVGHIHPQPRPCGGARLEGQANLFAVGIQPGIFEYLVERVERSTERRATPRAVQLRPEEIDQAVAGVTFPGDGEVGQQGDGFAPV